MDDREQDPGPYDEAEHRRVPDAPASHGWDESPSAPAWASEPWAAEPTSQTPSAGAWDPSPPPAASAWDPASTPAAGAWAPGRAPVPPPPIPWTAPSPWPSGPPAPGGGLPPTYGPPPVDGGLRHEAPRQGKGGRAVAIALIALVLLVAAAVAGGVVGRRSSDNTSTPALPASPVANTPVTTSVPPLKGDSAEPALQVAKVLGPAVVQIETKSGLGSGFVYDKSGLIMTAGHVTAGAKTVSVRLADGTQTEGKVLGQDDSTDVAVVKINPPADLTVAALATGVPTQVGETAIAIGSPFGLDQTVTAGIVSAVGRSVQTPGGVIPAVQTDAPINSGNSGGALADRQGRVIGINDSIVTGSSSSGSGNTGNVGVGFAIPIDIAKATADKLVAGDSTAAGFLGVEGADATGNRTGAALTNVAGGSPAAMAGLTTSDVVVSVNGQKVSSMIDLAALVRTHQPGEQVTLTVLRSGKERTVTVTLGSAKQTGTGG
jgi:putative serine protease PepD